MARKLLSVAILFAMILHCAGRLGVLSYLYEKKQDIAWHLGLISERPISICSSSYFGDKTLTLAATPHDAAAPGIPQAQEINLFYVSAPGVPAIIPAFSGGKATLLPPDHYDLIPGGSIFHPPARLV